MSPRPRGECRTEFEATLLGLMAEQHIEDYSVLAQKADTTTATIQRLCSGKRKGSVDTLQKLATALNCTVDDLITPET